MAATYTYIHIHETAPCASHTEKKNIIEPSRQAKKSRPFFLTTQTFCLIINKGGSSQTRSKFSVPHQDATLNHLADVNLSADSELPVDVSHHGAVVCPRQHILSMYQELEVSNNLNQQLELECVCFLMKAPCSGTFHPCMNMQILIHKI